MSHRQLLRQAPCVVAIPARDEAAHVAACLGALACGDIRPAAVIILLNNCTDESEAVIRRLRLPFPVHMPAVTLSPPRAHAGWARKIATDHAADLAGPTGLVLCTDADAIVPPNWLAANLAEIAAGADAVAGQAEIDPVEARAIPAVLHDDNARECAYAALVNEIDWRLDPDPADPWPRHDQHSGASIAVTVAAYRASGGIPPVPLGEDRAFFDALRRIDARIRHAPGVRVTVSGRTEGRAAGGMADTIRRRLTCPDTVLDPRLQPAPLVWRRALARRAAREAWIGPGPFGAAWAAMEAARPDLAPKPICVADLPALTAEAYALLARLRVCEPTGDAMTVA